VTERPAEAEEQCRLETGGRQFDLPLSDIEIVLPTPTLFSLPKSSRTGMRLTIVRGRVLPAIRLDALVTAAGSGRDSAPPPEALVVRTPRGRLMVLADRIDQVSGSRQPDPNVRRLTAEWIGDVMAGSVPAGEAA
jgi:chemotaxis signal transduction protein